MRNVAARGGVGFQISLPLLQKVEGGTFNGVASDDAGPALERGEATAGICRRIAGIQAHVTQADSTWAEKASGITPLRS